MNENYQKMYEGILMGEELTTKNLNSYGFSSRDLMNMVRSGILERVKRGHYSLVTMDGLYQYGEELLSYQEEDKAAQCFLKCAQLDSSCGQAFHKLVLLKIKSVDYKEAFQYIDCLFTLNDTR